MKQDISLLFEGIQGIKAWFDEVTSGYGFSHYRFEAIAPQDPDGMPLLRVFPDPRYPNRFFTITPDLERELWVLSDAESDSDNYPLGLYPTIFPWIVDAMASSNEDYITDTLNADLGNPVPTAPSKRLSVQVSLWGFAVRLLVDSARGELDNWYTPHVAENKAEARMRLPYHVATLWEWVNLGLENRLTEQGKANVDFLISEFRKLGFEDNYEVNLFQVAADHGKALAEISVDQIVKARNEREQQVEEERRKGKILGWVVPLVVGSIIAIGAALGY